MQKMTFRKLSILSLILMAASAVTAAFIPSNSKDANAKFSPGSLTASTVDDGDDVPTGLTCTAVDNNNGPACNVSASGTTENGISTNVGGSNSSDHP